MLKVCAEDLARSGITVKQAEAAGMYSVADASTVFSEFKKAPALIIPYCDPWTDDLLTFLRDKEDWEFCRVRYFGKEDSKQSFKKKKNIRYGQPKDSGVHPYYPIVREFSWDEVANDPSIPILITEGEKKALAGCLAGMPTLGLGGVFNFSHDGELLPEMEWIEWKGRTVYLCYDSDAADNIQIQVAEGRLATELGTKRHANVFLVRLPELPGGAKMGIDDFLVAKGREEFFDLLDLAPQMKRIDKEVLALNKDVVWIETAGLVLDLKSSVWIKPGNFVKGSKYSSIKLTVATGGKKAGLKEISVANEWLTHPHARRYDDTVFDPGNSNKAILNADGTVHYNLFRGLEGTEGDVEPFFDLLEYLTSKTPELDPDLIWKTLCYKIQNLAGRCDISFMLLGKQGSGKSLFGKICMGMVQPYATKLSMDMVAGDFNGWMEETLIAVIAETEGAKLRDNIGTIQSWITDKQQNVNEKYRVAKQVNNNTFFMLDSNELSAGFFPDDDRRMVVVHCPNRHPDESFYDDIGEWYEKGGPKHLLHYFQHYDLEGWTPPNKAPKTRAKHNMHVAGLTPLQKIGEKILDEKTNNLVYMWMQSAQAWAATAAGQPNVPHSLLDNVTTSLARLQIRPFYTPDELEMLLPALSAGIGQAARGRFTSAMKLAQELSQQGVPFLNCIDSLDGFRHAGQAQQYLIISDFDEYEDGLTQAEFTQLMRNFPTYKEYHAGQKAAKKARKSKRK